MNEIWRSAVITEISAAVYVAPNTGKHIHRNRPRHGLVLNDADCVRDYCFDDGRILHTDGNCLFYLPKGSSYHVENIRMGGCYAINFDADLSDNPFCIPLRNADKLSQNFKAATDAWKRRDPIRTSLAMRAVYDAICQGDKERHRQYVSGTQAAILAPALDAIHNTFTDNDLRVADLASLCGISEVYFRRLFLNSIGVSPKEYTIQKRIEYAKTMLKSGGFSVSEIATLCGYAEPCHFSREFTKRVGIPPRQYSNQP